MWDEERRLWAASVVAWLALGVACHNLTSIQARAVATWPVLLLLAVATTLHRWPRLRFWQNRLLAGSLALLTVRSLLSRCWPTYLSAIDLLTAVDIYAALSVRLVQSLIVNAAWALHAALFGILASPSARLQDERARLEVVVTVGGGLALLGAALWNWLQAAMQPATLLPDSWDVLIAMVLTAARPMAQLEACLSPGAALAALTASGPGPTPPAPPAPSPDSGPRRRSVLVARVVAFGSTLLLSIFVLSSGNALVAVLLAAERLAALSRSTAARLVVARE